MRLVQIGERNLLTLAIEEGLKSSEVEVFTYPPGSDAFFFVHDLKPQVALVFSLGTDFLQALELYPDLAQVPFILLADTVAFNEAHKIWPKLLHLPLPVAPLKLKAQIQTLCGFSS